MTVSERGQGKDGNALFFNDLSRQEAAFTPMVADVTNDRFQVIENVDETFSSSPTRTLPTGEWCSTIRKPVGKMWWQRLRIA